MTALVGRLTTGLVAAVVEAWQELRIHKLRVLLSLVGVMVAVASLTAAIALGAIGKQVLVEQYERDGRPALIGISAYDTTSGGTGSPELLRDAVAAAAERFDVSYVSVRGFGPQMTARSSGPAVAVATTIVDPPYATMHRIEPQSGRWLEPADTQNRSPAVVVDDTLLEALGLPPERLPTSITIGVKQPVTVTVVGSVETPRYTDLPTVYMLPEAYQQWYGADQPVTEASYEMWVPIKGSQQLADEVSLAIAAEMPGYQVDAFRQDYLSWGAGDDFDTVSLAVGAIASLILLLGTLSLLNVALVTIQQRVREVGIRRSFGATTSRIFFSVMMESIVATTVAGVLGVMLAVAAVNSPLATKYLLDGVQDVPPFPADAALLGIAVSIGVGALAGLLPAVIASRVKVIDAIRF